jgi:hypothetical protein
MTVSELIAKLSAYPGDARVTLLDLDKRWLLPIKISRVAADASGCGIDFIAIIADGASDEIEGMVDARIHHRGEPEGALPSNASNHNSNARDEPNYGLQNQK